MEMKEVYHSMGIYVTCFVKTCLKAQTAVFVDIFDFFFF